MKIVRYSVFIVTLFLFISCIYQRPDMQTDMSVLSPKYGSGTSPIVVFDAGHENFHSINTTYKPFATLLKNDGIDLGIHEGPFSHEALQHIELLIIANATGVEQERGEMASAFSTDEITTLLDWIQEGGSLLLIADHDPFGSAASDLAKAMNVGMESVWTVDTLRMNQDIGRTTWLEYTLENGGLGQHPILNTDSQDAAIESVITFTGQSLSFDSTWTSILQLSSSAQNYYQREDAKIATSDSTKYFPVPAQSQLIARQFGKGRVVIAGEAAMFKAQEVRILLKTLHAGFNYEGYDNKQLVLNIVHWLLSVNP